MVGTFYSVGRRSLLLGPVDLRVPHEEELQVGLLAALAACLVDRVEGRELQETLRQWAAAVAGVVRDVLLGMPPIHLRESGMRE